MQSMLTTKKYSAETITCHLSAVTHPAHAPSLLSTQCFFHWMSNMAAALPAKLLVSFVLDTGKKEILFPVLRFLAVASNCSPFLISMLISA